MAATYFDSERNIGGVGRTYRFSTTGNQLKWYELDDINKTKPVDTCLLGLAR